MSVLTRVSNEHHAVKLSVAVVIAPIIADIAFCDYFAYKHLFAQVSVYAFLCVLRHRTYALAVFVVTAVIVTFGRARKLVLAVFPDVFRLVIIYGVIEFYRLVLAEKSGFDGEFTVALL